MKLLAADGRGIHPDNFSGVREEPVLEPTDCVSASRTKLEKRFLMMDVT